MGEYISGKKAGDMICKGLGKQHYKELYGAMKRSCQKKAVGSGRATRYYYLESDVSEFIDRVKN